MKLSKEFYEKWEKFKVPYKVMVYSCGCKYIYITEEEKRIFKNFSFCPEHRTAKTYILLWCESCGLRIEAKPQSGYRQKRCFECSSAFLLEYNNINFKARYAGRYKNKTRKKTTDLQDTKKAEATPEDIKHLAVKKFISTIRQDLPVVETPKLDRLLNKVG